MEKQTRIETTYLLEVEWMYPLTETGVQQARTLIPNLPDDFDIVFSSSMKRTIQTTEIITEGKWDIKYIDEIREQDFGDFSGKHWKETGLLKEDGSKNLKALFDYPYENINGESKKNFRKGLNLL